MPDKIYYSDLLQDATLTVLSETTTYEKEYAVDDSPGNVWRTTGITSETFLMDLGSAILPASFIWIASNIVSGDTTFTLSAGTTTATSDKTVNMTKLEKGVYEILSTDGWIAYRYWKITVTKASGTYVEFGKIALLGEKETDICYEWDYTSGRMEVFTVNPGSYGQESRELKFNKKTINVSFPALTVAQKELLDETIRLEPYIYYYDSDKSEIWYGKAEFSTPVHFRALYWKMNLAFTEIK